MLQATQLFSLTKCRSVKPTVDVWTDEYNTRRVWSAPSVNWTVFVWEIALQQPETCPRPACHLMWGMTGEKIKKRLEPSREGGQRASEWTDELPAVLVCGSQLCSTVGLFGALIQNIAADRAQAQTLLSSFTPAALPAAEWVPTKSDRGGHKEAQSLSWLWMKTRY